MEQHKHFDLIEASLAGDGSAQYKLYELYADAMFNVAYRLAGTREDAEEITQDGFIAAFKNLKQFEFKSSFGSWLKKIVVNRGLNFLRSRKMVFDEWKDHHEETIVVEELSERMEDIEIVKEGIEKLPKGYKLIINLYLIEGFDHVEIAEILNITVGTSRSQYHRAKKRLLEIIKMTDG